MAIQLEVWGDYACFTRPEMKVERVSYDVMTPSAARGLLEAIYWHPGMRWYIDEIRVCSPIRFTNIKRNEISEVTNLRTVPNSIKKGKEMYIATSECCVQRNSMILKDVHYVISAHFEMTDKANASDNPGKFSDIIRRRIEKGQVYHTPYFGTREFAANFKPCTQLPSCPEELNGERDLGWMLLDMDYSNPADIKPMFFRAKLVNGVLTVPQKHSEEVFQ